MFTVLSPYIFCHKMWIVYIMWPHLGKPAYGGAHSVFLYQPFLYVYIHNLFFHCAEWEKSVFCRCSYVAKSPGSNQTTSPLKPLDGNKPVFQRRCSLKLWTDGRTAGRSVITIAHPEHKLIWAKKSTRPLALASGMARRASGHVQMVVRQGE